MTTPTVRHAWAEVKATKAPPVERWNPWQTLAEEYEDWKLVTEFELPGRIFGMSSPSRKMIWLCRRIKGVYRTTTLAHELTHIQLNIWNGTGTRKSADYVETERLVVEVTAQRLVPFRDLAAVVMDRPDAVFSVWAGRLGVDCHVLSDRFFTLSPVERSALVQLRGGPLPTMPVDPLYDAVSEVSS